MTRKIMFMKPEQISIVSFQKSPIVFAKQKLFKR
jgi:hypothetical protein